jgi:hypothetical protein
MVAVARLVFGLRGSVIWHRLLCYSSRGRLNREKALFLLDFTTEAMCGHQRKFYF